MPRRKSFDQSLTPLELEIMTVLWETGPANVQSVQARLTARNLAYTTVQTMLNVLERKGKVKRRLKDRAYFYQPIVPAVKTQLRKRWVRCLIVSSAVQPTASSSIWLKPVN